MGNIAKSALKALAVAASLAMTVSTAQAAKYELRLGHVTSDKEPIQKALERFASNVERKTDGRVHITIYPNGTLGTNAEVYQQVLAGAPVITVSDPSFLSDYVPDFGVLGGPYLVNNPRDFDKILKSPLFATMKDRLRKKGIELLALNWFFGDRDLIAGKAVHSPADMAGMTVRTPPNAMWVKTFEAMGARPTQLAWTEVYSALSTGVVDAAEAPLPSLYAAKLYEAKRTISLTDHFKGFTGLIINAKYFASLPKDIQNVLSDEAKAAGVYMTDLMLNSKKEWIKKLEKQGVTINSDVNVAAFRKATEKVYREFPKWSPGLYDKVRAIIDK